MNFTSDVKKEIIARGISGGAAKKAALSAFVRTSGQLFFREGKPVFSIVTETENVAEFFMDLFGSCIVPGKEGGKTGYHLEFVFPEKRAADDFRRLLDDAELLAKVVERNGCAVVYIKSKETISDFLSVVGAANALKKFSHLVEKRDEANNSNRAANCFSGTADKSATAAVRQVLAIRAIEETSGLDALETELKETAEARLNNPALSLKELAQRLGISKSCLNHRMRKIEEISARAFRK